MIKRIISLVLSVFSILSIFSDSPVKNENINKFSIIKDAELVGSMKGENGYSIEILFSEPKAFDTVVIEEKDNNITSFTISVKDENGDYIVVYRQDAVGEYRYCSIGEYKSTAVKITVNDTTDNKFKLKNIDVLNVVNNKNSDFRVTSYVVCPTFYAQDEYDVDKIKTLTDVILSGVARFDEHGNIFLQDSVINGNIVTGDTIFKSIVNGLRNINPNINIHCNALGPDGVDATHKETLHSQAFIDNGDVLSNNVIKLLEEYNFDGFFFDYEYPYQKKSRKDFSKFLVKLDLEMDDYILGAALSGWNCDLSKKAIKALDRVEIMAYDDMSSRIHSDFGSYGGALSVLTFEKQGYDLSKCDLGLPFYGRTHSGEEPWPSYAQIVPDLNNDPFLNVINKSYMTGEYGEIWTSFNGVQLVKDKTTFANDYGVGGVFSWHYSCDVPYESDMSLFKAIQTALDTRN